MKSKDSFNFVRNFFAIRTRKAAQKKLDKYLKQLIKDRFNAVQRKSRLLCNRLQASTGLLTLYQI